MAKQLLADHAIVGTIAVAVLVSGLFLSATPLLFNRLADEALLDAVTKPEPQLRNISASLSSRVGAAARDEPFAGVQRRGELFREDQMPELVQEIIEEEAWVTDSPRFFVKAMPDGGRTPRFPTFIRMRYQQEIDQHVSLIGGAMPSPHDPVLVELGHDCPLTGNEDDSEDLDCAEVALSVFEVAITQETLDYFPVGIGGMMLLTPDSCAVRRCGGVGVARSDDTAYFGIPAEDLQYAVVLRISGLIEIEEQAGVYWYGDPRLHRPRVVSNADFTFVYATGLMMPADYGTLLRKTRPAPWNYEWRYFVAAERIRQGNIDRLAADLTTLQNEFPPFGRFGDSHMGLNTKLPRIIDDYVGQRDLTLRMMSTSIVGLFVVAVAVIFALSALISERQRDGLILLRNRGSSRVQLMVSRTIQGLILTAPFAGLALYLATTLVPGTSSASARLTIGLVAAATVLIVLASRSAIFRDLGSLQRPHYLIARASARRLVFETLFIVVAIGAIVILRRRGSVGVDEERLDLLQAIAPVLLGLAVGLITLRLYPYPIRFFAWLGSKSRGLVTFVGFQRVVQQPSAARLPLIVMLIAVSLAGFSSVVRFSINEGQSDSTWHETGAAYRFAALNPADPLTDSLDLSEIESVEAQAWGVRFPDAFSRGETGTAMVDLLFLEGVDYATVNAGTPADPHLPTFMTIPPDHDSGTEGNPIPVIASHSRDGRPASDGDVLTVNLGRLTVFFVVREVRETFPGMPLDRAFVVADLRPFEALSRPETVRPTVIYVRAEPAALDELEEAASSQTLATILTSQAALLTEIRNEPFVIGVDRGLQMSFWLATIFAVVTAVSSLALLSSTRRRDFGYLRTQGLTSRQAVWLTVIEQTPAIVVAAVIGSLLGVGIAFVLEPVISFTAFSGGELEAGVIIDPPAIALLTLGLIIVLTLVTGIFGYVNRETDLGDLLRMGDE